MTPTSSNSRKGRPIAKKACDCCRIRKTQCIFGPDDASTCTKCLASKVPCTFLRDRRQRGPVSRRLAEFRQHVALSSPEATASASASASVPGSSPVAKVEHGDHLQIHEALPSAASMTTPPYSATPLGSPLPVSLPQVVVGHLVSEDVFRAILHDFIDRIYPCLPLVHLPDLRDAIDRRLYDTHPEWLRICFSLCAVTIASVPRKFAQYSQGAYKSVGRMVEKAAHIVLLSRLTTDPSWQTMPSQPSMIVSVMLAMACLYAGFSNAGWAHVTEAIHHFRTLRLYRKESYARLKPVEAEIYKRMFWSMYIMQTHDRMSFVHAHTGLSYDPMHTDWEFLLNVDDNAGLGLTREVSTLTGFVANNRVFLAVADLLAEVFPGQPYPCVLPLDKLGFDSASRNAFHDWEPDGSLHSRKMRSFLRVRHRLVTIIENLPPALRPLDQHKLTSIFGANRRQSGENEPEDGSELDRTGYFSRSGTPPGPADILAVQMEAMWANVQVTSLYIQSVFLEVCIDCLERGSAATTMSMEAATSPMSLVSCDSMQQSSASDPLLRAKLQAHRHEIAEKTLQVVNACCSSTLESNGASMIAKIREIAATMLESDDAASSEGVEARHRSRMHVQEFVKVLARLDHATRLPHYSISELAEKPESAPSNLMSIQSLIGS